MTALYQGYSCASHLMALLDAVARGGGQTLLLKTLKQCSISLLDRFISSLLKESEKIDDIASDMATATTGSQEMKILGETSAMDKNTKMSKQVEAISHRGLCDEPSAVFEVMRRLFFVGIYTPLRISSSSYTPSKAETAQINVGMAARLAWTSLLCPALTKALKKLSTQILVFGQNGSFQHKLFLDFSDLCNLLLRRCAPSPNALHSTPPYSVMMSELQRQGLKAPTPAQELNLLLDVGKEGGTGPSLFLTGIVVQHNRLKGPAGGFSGSGLGSRESHLSSGYESLRVRSLLHLAGLRNLGNSCYMNAVVQALFQVIPFRQALLQRMDTHRIPSNLASKHKYCLQLVFINCSPVLRPCICLFTLLSVPFKSF